MQSKKVSSNVQISNRKGSSSRTSQQQSFQQINNSINSLKQRQDAIIKIVKQYLQRNGYPRTLEIFKNQKPIRRILPSLIVNKNIPNHLGNDQQKIIMNVIQQQIQLFQRGNRDQFFKHVNKIFNFTTTLANNQQNLQILRKLQFQLQIYFCIYNLHPYTLGCNKKNQQVEKSCAQAFKKYIDTKGNQVSEQSQLLTFFALPYIPKPHQNHLMAKVFTKQWLTKLRVNLQQTLRQSLIRNPSTSNKQNKKSPSSSFLHQIYDFYQDVNSNQSKLKQQIVDQKLIQKYQRDIHQLKLHNKQMVAYLDIMQQNLKDMNQATKNNLVQSNRKWFQFSKQIMQLTKKALKGQNVKDKLQKYQRFFGTNIDQLIYATGDISLFEKNSYTQDHSIIPNAIKIQKNLQNLITQIPPIDYTKLSTLFLKSNKSEYQLQICLVLKALKQRMCYYKNTYLKRQIVISYQRNDLCAIKDNNYQIQKKLLLQSTSRIKQFYLRLMNHISTDDWGNKYLSGSQKLIKNLIQIMGSTTQDNPCRKHVFGILQKNSFLKQSQFVMISFGIIPMIFKIFRNQGDTLRDVSIQYLMGLIMNLAVKKQSIITFEKHKSQIIPILLKYIDVDNNQIKGFVNGTLYVLLQIQSIKRQAIQKYKIKDTIKKLHDKSVNKLGQLQPDQIQTQNCVIRQYGYILQRLQQINTSSLDNDQNSDDDDQQQQGVDDISDMDIFSDNDSNSSEYIQGQENTLNGQQLLMKKFALLGPQAVRQQIINRSILDETSRKSNNMTTSINHSKRIDKVFHKNQKPQTPSLLAANLDL